jgi:hypothetical protein
MEYLVSERTIQRIVAGKVYMEIDRDFSVDNLLPMDTTSVVGNLGYTENCALQHIRYKDGSIKVLDNDGQFIEVKRACVLIRGPKGRYFYHIYRDVRILSSSGKEAVGEIKGFEHPDGRDPFDLTGNLELDESGWSFYPVSN